MAKNNEETKALTINSANVVLPAMSGDEALKVWEQYQDLINKVCTKEDYQIIEGKNFRKKSGWRKIATFFNLSTEVVEERREQVGKTLLWHFTVKAIAPNGRFAVGVGSCDVFEKAKLVEGEYKRYNKFSKMWEKATPNSLHNTRSTAETRAVNRAISNLVGGGEVSAEEVADTNGHTEIPTTATPAPRAASALATDSVTYTKCRYCGTTGKYHKKGCPGAPAMPTRQPAAEPEPNGEPVVVPTDEGGGEEVAPEDIPF